MTATVIRSAFIHILLAILLAPVLATADELKPALLSLTEHPDNTVKVVWKRPLRGNQVLLLEYTLPEFLESTLAPTVRVVAGAQVEHRVLTHAGETLAGQTIRVRNFDGLSTGVLLQVQLLDGTRYSAILSATNPGFKIPLRQTRAEVATAYWQMGTIHILEGADHLLFVTALLLIVQGLWPLVKTITAFTVAHSVTLALATFGLVNLPPAPTEAVIALSIVLLAAEVLRKQAGESTLSEQAPWLVAFSFGLVHGLGFAGALAEIGLPQADVPLALLMFNLGVETGQVLFVLVLWFLLIVLQRLHLSGYALLTRTMPYVIGSVAAFWTIQRIDGFV